MLQKMFIIASVLIVVHSLIQMESAYNLTVKDLDNSLVRIVQNSSKFLRIQYFGLTIENRQKSKALNLFKHKYKKIVQVLKHYYPINSQSQLIKSQTKSRYIPRLKVWQLSSTFAIEQHHFSHQILLQLEQLGAKVLKDNNQIKYLKQKWISSKIFTTAKLQLMERLSRISDELEIKYVDAIEIQGLNDYDEMEKIQSELQSQEIELFSHSIIRADFCQNHNIFSQQNLKMEVIFKVGRKKNSLQYRNFNKFNQSALFNQASLVSDDDQQ